MQTTQNNHSISFSQKMVLAGIGGQGIIFLTRLLAHAATESGYAIIASEIHGMSQRGAPVASHLSIGNYIASAQIPFGFADVLIAFDLQEAIIHLPYLREGGLLIMNSTTSMPMDLQPFLVALKIKIFIYDLNEIPISYPKNVVMAGILLNHLSKKCFNLTIMETVLARLSTSPQKKEINLQALHFGINLKNTILCMT